MAKTRRAARPLSVDQAIVAVLLAAADANRHIAPAEPATLRASAFATAVDLMLADGRIERDERAFVRALATTLKLPSARAEEVVRVMRVKNGA